MENLVPQKALLQELKSTLQKAINIASSLECFCEDGFVCGKHELVNSIVNSRDVVRTELNSMDE